MRSQLERLIFARDDLVKLNDRIYELMTEIRPESADQIEETIDMVSICMEEIIEGQIKK